MYFNVRVQRTYTVLKQASTPFSRCSSLPSWTAPSPSLPAYLNAGAAHAICVEGCCPTVTWPRLRPTLNSTTVGVISNMRTSLACDLLCVRAKLPRVLCDVPSICLLLSPCSRKKGVSQHSVSGAAGCQQPQAAICGLLRAAQKHGKSVHGCC
jgi:hypothetical protein